MYSSAIRRQCLVTLAAVLVGCAAEVEPVGGRPAPLVSSGRDACFSLECMPHVLPLRTRWRDRDVGTVAVEVVDGQLVATLEAEEGWTFQMARLFVDDEGDQPRWGRRNRPKVELFPRNTSSAELRADVGELACGESVNVAVNVVARHPRRGYAVAWAAEASTRGWFRREYFAYEICCAADACTMDAAFYRDNPDQWPPYVTSLGMGGEMYTQEEIIDLLSQDPTGDASLYLAQAWINFGLNWYCGVDATDEEWDALLGANSWFYRGKDADGRLPYGTDPSSTSGAEALSYLDTLEEFSAGLGSAPACY